MECLTNRREIIGDKNDIDSSIKRTDDVNCRTESGSSDSANLESVVNGISNGSTHREIVRNPVEGALESSVNGWCKCGQTTERTDNKRIENARNENTNNNIDTIDILKTVARVSEATPCLDSDKIMEALTTVTNRTALENDTNRRTEALDNNFLQSGHMNYDGLSEASFVMDIDDEMLPPYTRYVGEPPPPYTTTRLRAVILDAKEDASGHMDLLKRVITAFFCNAVSCGVLILIMITNSLVMLSIGYRNIYDCPRQRYIPIYLMVGGAFGLIKVLVNIVELVRNKALASRREQSGIHSSYRSINPLDLVMTVFLFAWLCSGCMWTFSIYGDHQNTDNLRQDYCSRIVFNFAFWVNISILILIGLIILCGCGLLACVYHYVYAHHKQRHSHVHDNGSQ